MMRLMIDKEAVKKTEKELKQALTGGAVQFEGWESEKFINLFGRSVKILQDNRDNESLLRAFAILLGLLRCAEGFLYSHRLTWEGDLVIERGKRVLLEEIALCPSCQAEEKEEKCGLFALTKAFDGQPPEEVLNLAAEVRFYTGGIIEAIKEYTRGGSGMVIGWAGPPNHRDLN